MDKYDNRIVVKIHKEDRGDLTIQFLYRKKDEKMVLKEIKKIWEIIRYNP